MDQEFRTLWSNVFICIVTVGNALVRPVHRRKIAYKQTILKAQIYEPYHGGRVILDTCAHAIPQTLTDQTCACLLRRPTSDGALSRDRSARPRLKLAGDAVFVPRAYRARSLPKIHRRPDSGGYGNQYRYRIRPGWIRFCIRYFGSALHH